MSCEYYSSREVYTKEYNTYCLITPQFFYHELEILSSSLFFLEFCREFLQFHVLLLKHKEKKISEELF